MLWVALNAVQSPGAFELQMPLLCRLAPPLRVVAVGSCVPRLLALAGLLLLYTGQIRHGYSGPCSGHGVVIQAISVLTARCGDSPSTCRREGLAQAADEPWDEERKRVAIRCGLDQQPQGLQ